MSIADRLADALKKVVSDPLDWKLSRSIRELATEYPQVSILLMDELSRWLTNPDLRKRYVTQAAFLIDLANALDRVALGIRAAVFAAASKAADAGSTSAAASTAADANSASTSAAPSAGADASPLVSADASMASDKVGNP